MRGRGIREHFRWPLGLDAVWLASPLFVIALSALLSPIRPFDYFWALVQGRACVQLGHVPTSNLFLFTLPPTEPFFNQPWLAQLAMFAAYSCCGHSANLWLLAALSVLAFALVLDAALRKGATPSRVALIALLAASFVAAGSGARTQMFAYPCFAYFIRLITLRQETYGARSLIGAGSVAALWANVHGSFVLLPLILGVPVLARVFEARFSSDHARAFRGSLRLLIAASLGTLVNPRGPLVYAYVLHYGSAVQATGTTDVTEWQAPSWTSPLGAALVASFAASTLVLVFRRRAARLDEGVLLLLFGALSLTSQRFLCWWALTAVASMSPLLGTSSRDPEQRGAPLANVGLLLSMAITVLLCLPGAPLFERVARDQRVQHRGARALGVETPIAIGKTLARDFRGRLFHDQALGGFVEWVLAESAPKPVAFVDQRFELTPAELWRDYFAVYEAQKGWREVLARYSIDGLLLHEERAAELVRALAREPEWRLDAREAGYRLYTRRAPHSAASR